MKREQFNMTSMKLKKKGVHITWVENEKDMSSDSRNDYHPDMYSALQVLVPVVREVFHFSSNDNTVEVIGVTLFTKKEQDYVIISHKFETDTLQKVGFTTGQIEINGSDYNFQETLGENIEKIIDESYEYAFKKKYGGQHDLFFHEGFIP